MRFLLSTVALMASLWGWGQSDAPWHLGLSCGPTGYTGSDEGPAAQGSFLTTFSVRRDLSEHVRAVVECSRGQFGLTAAPFARSMERVDGGLVGLQWHPNWSRNLRINPHVGWSVGRFQQAVWTDALDERGLPYHVWSDGGLYDMSEDALYAAFHANPVQPDFQVETRTFAAAAWSMPLQMGLDWQLTDAWTLEASGTVFVGLQPQLAHAATQAASAMTTVAVGIGWHPGSRLLQDPDIPSTFLDHRADADLDGVRDRRDRCFNSPQGAPVDRRGCPTDADGDGIADYLDLEPNSSGPVDAFGRQLDRLPPTVAPAAPVQLDFQQIIADPETGKRPHLPLGPTEKPTPTQRFENP